MRRYLSLAAVALVAACGRMSVRVKINVKLKEQLEQDVTLGLFLKSGYLPIKETKEEANERGELVVAATLDAESIHSLRVERIETQQPGNPLYYVAFNTTSADRDKIFKKRRAAIWGREEYISTEVQLGSGAFGIFVEASRPAP